MPPWSDCHINCEDDHKKDGVIQKYIHLTREFEAPTSYHVFAFLAAIAASTNRQVVIDRGGYRLWPNLYVLLHGPSGLGKGIASGHAIDLVTSAVGPRLRFYPEDLTGEGLFRIMHEQTEAGEPCVGLVFADEFADLLGGQNYKEEFAKRITRLYSSPDRMGVGRSMSGERWVENVFLSIIGCSQEDWLRTLPIHALKGGLFARFLTIPEKVKRHWCYEPHVDRVLAKEIAETVADRLAAIPDSATNVVSQTDSAKRMGEDWYYGEDVRWKTSHHIVKPFLERRLDHAIKLGFLNTLIEGNTGPLEIDEGGLEWGLDVVEWLTPRIEEAFLSMNESPAGELQRIITSVLDEHGGEVIEPLVRQALGHKFRAGMIDEAIRGLIMAGKMTRIEKPHPDLRKGTAWWLIEVKD